MASMATYWPPTASCTKVIHALYMSYSYEELHPTPDGNQLQYTPPLDVLTLHTLLCILCAVNEGGKKN